MLSNITFNPQKETACQQDSLKEGDIVYLYGDRNFTGTLIRLVERTHPQKWSVKLDQGGYEAANVDCISLITSYSSNEFKHDLDIPFDDEPEPTISQLEKEIIALKTENAQLKQENEFLKKDLDRAKQVIRRAKDISPIVRISLKRVLRLAHDACMEVKRTVGGWILKMGNKARKFKRLADIWDILSQDNWYLSEIFAPHKLIATELILPPRPRKKPNPPYKKTFPLIQPEEVLRRRRMGMPKCL